MFDDLPCRNGVVGHELLRPLGEHFDDVLRHSVEVVLFGVLFDLGNGLADGLHGVAGVNGDLTPLFGSHSVDALRPADEQAVKVDIGVLRPCFVESDFRILLCDVRPPKFGSDVGSSPDFDPFLCDAARADDRQKQHIECLMILLRDAPDAVRIFREHLVRRFSPQTAMLTVHVDKVRPFVAKRLQLFRGHADGERFGFFAFLRPLHEALCKIFLIPDTLSCGHVMPHIAGRDRQQVMGKRVEHALDGRFQVRAERRQNVAGYPQIQEKPLHLPRRKLLPVVRYSRFGNAPVEKAIPRDAGDLLRR